MFKSTFCYILGVEHKAHVQHKSQTVSQLLGVLPMSLTPACGYCNNIWLHNKWQIYMLLHSHLQIRSTLSPTTYSFYVFYDRISTTYLGKAYP